MKLFIGALAGLLGVAGVFAAQPAQAQGWQYQTQPYAAPTQPYVERRDDRREGGPRYGSDVRERCIGLHREAESLRIRMDREWNPMERARTEGRLRGVQNEEARAGCR
jgi:hypothetical protein